MVEVDTIPDRWLRCLYIGYADLVFVVWKSRKPAGHSGLTYGKCSRRRTGMVNVTAMAAKDTHYDEDT
jgi:hypothetical protein